MGIIAGSHIAQLAQMACVLEACADKPGNINRRHDFVDTSLEDLLLSAIAIGPALERAGQAGIGRTVLDAVADTRRHVKSNTNLGMVLLFAPLAKALRSAAGCTDLRKNLNNVLNSTTVEDACLTYAAVRLAQPGGLSRVSESDITEEPSITLVEAMDLAKGRDSVAREYVTNFEITFEIGLPALKESVSRCGDLSAAIVQAFLVTLSRVPDTLIARKRGLDTARQVSQLAADVLAQGGIFSPAGKSAVAAMDQKLRDPRHALNPGTTADLTAAAIFLLLLEKQISL